MIILKCVYTRPNTSSAFFPEAEETQTYIVIRNNLVLAHPDLVAPSVKTKSPDGLLYEFTQTYPNTAAFNQFKSIVIAALPDWELVRRQYIDTNGHTEVTTITHSYES